MQNRYKKPANDLPQLGKWRLTSAEEAPAGTGGRWYFVPKDSIPTTGQIKVI